MEDLHKWIVQHFQEHPLFAEVTEQDLVSTTVYFFFFYTIVILTNFFVQAADPIVEKLYESTEEGKKVTRNKGNKFLAVFKRIADLYVATNS